MKFSQLGDIAIAWYRSIHPTPEQQDLAMQRLSVCESCDQLVSARSLEKDYRCGACGCPIHKKIFSPRGPDKCPLGKWTE